MEERGKLLVMGLMWNQGICSWFGFSQVGVERGLFFPGAGGMKMSNLGTVQIVWGSGY